jgi:hypothetical protein
MGVYEGARAMIVTGPDMRRAALPHRQRRTNQVLKRRHGLRRCRYRRASGLQRWVGLGVLANDLLGPRPCGGLTASERRYAMENSCGERRTRQRRN